MIHTLRIPAKEQYAFYEFQFEGTVEEAMAEYKRITDLVHGNQGVGIPKLAEIVIELVRTGGIVEGGNYDFSASESLLVGAITKCLRKEKQ